MKLAALMLLAIGCSHSTPAASTPISVDALVANPQPGAAHISVVGWVAPGSIATKIVDERAVRTFTLTANGASLRVRHEGPIPDTFKDDAETTVSGKLVREEGALLFVADPGDAALHVKPPPLPP